MSNSNNSNLTLLYVEFDQKEAAGTEWYSQSEMRETQIRTHIEYEFVLCKFEEETPRFLGGSLAFPSNIMC